MYRSHVMVCGGTGCTSSNSDKIAQAFETEIQATGLQDEVKVIRTGCFGLCALGPIVVIYPEGSFYSMVKEENVKEIVDEHLLKGRPVTRLLYDETVAEDNTIKSLDETAFYKKQLRIALRNCGVINPENIDEYIAFDGYAALGKVLTEMTPEQVIQTMLDSGLRGRGGAGFPTGLKWKFAAGNKADQKYVCCNADEGDPGAFMDRSILEGDPHVVIEAMAIAAYAIGASQGYVYIRAEYPIAVQRLTIAINQAREYGLLGKNIFGTDFCFDLDIKLGAGGLIVMDEDTCMVDIAKFFLEFTVDESCGKCTPCRVGTKRLLELLTKITDGKGTMEDLDKITELAEFIKANSLCGLGQTAPNPVLSTLRYFRDEYEEHIKNKRCPAGVCKALLNYKIDPVKCKGCTLCARACPAGAITGTVRQPHAIDTAKCVKCGACMEKCKFGAISKG